MHTAQIGLERGGGDVWTRVGGGVNLSVKFSISRTVDQLTTKFKEVQVVNIV